LLPRKQQGIVDRENWTTTLSRIPGRIGPILGGKHGSEAATDRAGLEGQGGGGGGARGADDRRTGRPVRRSSHADRTMEKQLLDGAVELFSGEQHRKVENQDALIAELYEQIGRLQMEAAWLKKKVARLD